jgi:hypothetical protein
MRVGSKDFGVGFASTSKTDLTPKSLRVEESRRSGYATASAFLVACAMNALRVM